MQWLHLSRTVHFRKELLRLCLLMSLLRIFCPTLSLPCCAEWKTFVLLLLAKQSAVTRSKPVTCLLGEGYGKPTQWCRNSEIDDKQNVHCFTTFGKSHSPFAINFYQIKTTVHVILWNLGQFRYYIHPITRWTLCWYRNDPGKKITIVEQQIKLVNKCWKKQQRISPAVLRSRINLLAFPGTPHSFK